jgi:hypothetical protein
LLDNFASFNYLSNNTINDYKLSKGNAKWNNSLLLSNEPHATAIFHVSVNLILILVPRNLQTI